jgi:endonuclease/exonuclease/phosphatase family metal-dependent hydrolase
VPSITETPPAPIREELTRLRRQLSHDVPKKTDRNLLIATWNIREFGNLTPKWNSTEGDTPKRDLHALACIKEIVKRFDVVAIQEAQKRLGALRELLVGLGRSWAVILTDPVEDDKGDDERLAFLFDRSRLEVSGLACELVVPYSWSKAKRPKTGIAAIALERQFARTPYAVSFRRGSAIFTLVTLHVYWGSKSDQDIEERTKELSSIATWLQAWARDPDTWDQNLICLGDFNIDRSGSALWQAFTSTNLTTPVELQSPNRQVGGRPLEHFYDQISWFTEAKDGSKPLLSLRYTDRAGLFDWSLTALAETGLTGQQKSFRISDHYPLWVEFVVP